MAVDCHIHMALDGGYWKTALARHKNAPDEAFIRKTLETYKTLGFTYLRDGGDRWNAGKGTTEALSGAALKRSTISARLSQRSKKAADILSSL